MLGISCSMQDVLVVVCEIFSYDIWDLSLQHVNALVMVYEFLVAACGISFPNQELNLGPLPWELGILATGPTRKKKTRICVCLLEARHLFWVDGELGKVSDEDNLEISLLSFSTLWHSGHRLLQHLSPNRIIAHWLKCSATRVEALHEGGEQLNNSCISSPRLPPPPSPPHPPAPAKGPSQSSFSVNIYWTERMSSFGFWGQEKPYQTLHE